MLYDENTIKKGWDFSARILGADIAAQHGYAYFEKVNDAITDLQNSINTHTYRGQDIAHFKGYVAEEWHAGTFNVNAVAAGVKDRASTLNSNALDSVDILLNSGGQYSAKVYSDGAKSGIAQARISPDTGRASYENQWRLVASDHLEGARNAVDRQALRNAEIRPDVANAYSETSKKLVDRISNEDGITSIPETQKTYEQIAHDGKEGAFDPDNYGVSPENIITNDVIIKQAVKAGYTAAAVTVAIQLAPEIYKAIDYLIKTGEINLAHIKKVGLKGLSSGAEGFLRGSLSCALLIQCHKGVLGEALKSIDPTSLGTVVAIVLETVKNSILVAAGRMTAREMGSAFVDSVVVSAGYVLGAKIGGIIGQALGFQLPVIGYLIGSLIGCAFAAVYNIGKKFLISLCIETGFTCFGLVEQDYTLPEEILVDYGIDLIPVNRTMVSRTEINRSSGKNYVNRINTETVDIKILRRGLIGVNKVGYIL